MVTCSFFKTSFDTHYFELDRILTFGTLLHCPASVFMMAIFWSGLQSKLSPISDNVLKVERI